jgi:hypothetical protein
MMYDNLMELARAIEMFRIRNGKNPDGIVAGPMLADEILAMACAVLGKDEVGPRRVTAYQGIVVKYDPHLCGFTLELTMPERNYKEGRP